VLAQPVILGDMKRQAVLFATALSLLGCGSSQSTAVTPAVTPPPASGPALTAQQVIDASNQFSIDLYRGIASANANTAASPFSAHTAFAMTREGARGETRAEFDRVLHLDGNAGPGFHAMTERVAAIGQSGVELRAANRVFVEQSLAMQPTFAPALEQGFGAPFEAVDFVSAAEPARVRINGWVAGQTADRIQDLLPGGAIDSNTRLVLTNAVYFHGNWARAFEASRTAPMPFQIAGQGVPVPMMQAEMPLRFARAEGVTVGELPYAGGQVSMLVAVPTDPNGLGALLSNLSTQQVQGWVNDLSEQHRVIVKLPRFRITPTSSVGLSAPMQALGLRLAFSDAEADLTGIAEANPRLYVAEAYHRAFIEVNEEGTEAAAATAVVVATRSAPMMPPEPAALIADRPFLFMLRDTQTGAILFMGHVADPR
jgi:serpin B